MHLSPSYHPKAGAADRRRQPRTVFEKEILILDPQTLSVRDVLVGDDLSAQGMRVEPHPSLALGECLQLAFFDECGSEPVRVTAEAARDDGKLGWLLRFVDLDKGVSRQIHRLMRRLPAIESFGSSADDVPEGVQFARIEPKSVLG
ncbi:MAG TPA: PilZ domain-containing protein [Myxococcota bacterium]